MNGCKNPQPEGAEQSTKKRACAMASRRPPQHTVCGHFLIGKEREREKRNRVVFYSKIHFLEVDGKSHKKKLGFFQSAS
jgi:hypothetical protein